MGRVLYECSPRTIEVGEQHKRAHAKQLTLFGQLRERCLFGDVLGLYHADGMLGLRSRESFSGIERARVDGPKWIAPATRARDRDFAAGERDVAEL